MKEIKSSKSQTKKVSLEPPFKNINSLCGPDVLWQAIPQLWAIMAESRLPVGFCMDFGDC